MKTPPGPRALPVLGNALELALDPLAYLTRLTRKYGDVVSFRMGAQRAVLLNEPALIDRVVRDRRFVRSEHTRRGLSSLLGPGLLTLEGVSHLRHRRLMQPAFHRERMQHYVAIMVDETYRVLGQWRDGEARDLHDDMSRLTLSIVARSLLNKSAASEAERFGRALERAVPAVLRSALISCFLPLRAPLYGRSTRAAIAELHALVRGIVSQRRAAGGDHGDLLSMLLTSRDEAGGMLSDDEICGEVLTILLAGHDTIAQTLSWAWYLLTSHPEIQEQLAAEVQQVAGARPLAYEDLPRLELADRVARETMRLYPASWWSDRVWDQPTELAGFTIPANTLVVFSPYVTHRDGRYFADPARFDPARFDPEHAARIPAGAYLPFGAGVHGCIGSGFAMLEAKLILSAMAQRFSFQTVRSRPVRPKPVITLGMGRPLLVVPRARNARVEVLAAMDRAPAVNN